MEPIVLVDAVLEEVTCPICMTFLREPMSVNCGHTFCNSCLSRLWEIPMEFQDWGYICPLCRAPVQPTAVRHNWQLGSVVEKIRLLGLQPGMGLQGSTCEVHRQHLTEFCREDGLLMCKACSQAPEHSAHRIVPMEDVSWEYKVGAGTGAGQPILLSPTPACLSLNPGLHQGLPDLTLVSHIRRYLAPLPLRHPPPCFHPSPIMAQS